MRYQQKHILLCILCLVWWIPDTLCAGELFSGIQVDTKYQYFGYVGARIPVYESIFVQGSTGGFGYGEYDTHVQVLRTDVQFLNTAIGLTKSYHDYTIGILTGTQFRRFEEEHKSYSRVGGFAQIELGYQRERLSVQTVFNYTSLSNFFWSRIRGGYQIHSSVFGGFDVAAMGNAGYYAIQTGPVIMIPIRDVLVLMKGGYQTDSTFHSGAYGGLEYSLSF